MNSSQITLGYVGTLNGSESFEYPYYPVIALIFETEGGYLAIKSHTGLSIQTISQTENPLIHKPYPILCQGLPQYKPITALEFVKRDIAFGNFPDLEKKYAQNIIFLLVGFGTGELLLVLIKQKEGKVIWRFNEQAENKGIFRRTLSYLNPLSQQYKVWQKFTILHITSKRSLTYLLRNNIIVHTYSLIANMTHLQHKFKSLINFGNKTIYSQEQKNVHMISNPNFQHIWDSNGFLLCFKSTVSNYHINQKSFYIGTFDGSVFLFNRQNMQCEQQISTQIGIRHITTYNDIIIVCLQDDKVQLIDIQTDQFLNLVGHNSFASESRVVRDHLLVTSFDGCISITKIPQRKHWISIYKNSSDIKQLKVGQKLSLMNPPCGIGGFQMSNNYLVCSMQDFSIQILMIS